MTSCPIIGGADFQPPKIYFLRTYNTYIIILSDNGASYYRWLFLPEQRRPPIIGQLLYPTIPCILEDSILLVSSLITFSQVQGGLHDGNTRSKGQAHLLLSAKSDLCSRTHGGDQSQDGETYRALFSNKSGK